MSQYLLRFDNNTSSSTGDYVTLASPINISGSDDFSVVIDGTPAANLNFWRVLGGNNLGASAPRVLIFGGGGIRLDSSLQRTWNTGLDITTINTLEFRRVSGQLDLYVNGVLQAGGFSSETSAFNGFGIIGGSFGTASLAFDLRGLQVEVNGTLIHNYDPSASNGTGTTLFDTVGGNNGTLVNFDVPACWVLIPSAGVTADGNFTLPTLTITGNASATTPAFTANGNFTLPAITLTGEASASLPQPVIAGAFTLPALSLTGAAAATLPQPIAAGDFTLAALTISGSASATLPNPVITGNFTLPTLSISGVLQATQPNFNIVGNFDLPTLTISGTASATQPQPSIVGSFTMPALTLTGAATATLPNPVAVGSFTLPTLSISGTASVTEPVFTIDGNFTLPALTMSGQASATLPQPVINGSFTMPSLQINGVAIVGGVAIIDAGDNIIYEPQLSNIVFEPQLSNVIYWR